MKLKLKQIAILAILVLVFSNFSGIKAQAAGAFVTLSAFSGTPGSPIMVSGGGYANGETVRIFLRDTSSSPVAAATAGQNSLFGPVSITLPPNTPQGIISIIGIGSVSGLQASNSFFVIPFNPSITVTNNSNTPFSSVMLNGSGFAPNEKINFTLSTAASTTTANSAGSFSGATIIIPVANPATYILRALGADSGAEAIGYFYISGFFPGISPSAYYILPGQSLNFSGSGYAPNERINIFEGNASTPLASFNAGTDGAFANAGAVPIPFSFAGSTRTFNLTGSQSHSQANVDITIGKLFPSIFPSAYYIPAGQVLNFSGAGFGNNETVNILLAKNKIGSFSAAADGSYKNAGGITVPANLAGTNPVFRLVGAESGGEADVTITVAGFFPQLTPSTYYIVPGQILNLSGSGFAPNETVDLAAGNNTAIKATTDNNGIFSGVPMTVPFSKSPTLNITASGETSNANAAATVTLGQFFATVAPSSYYLAPGDTVSFTGSGFAPNENVNIAAGLQNSNGSTDAHGNFNSAKFTIPLNANGQIIYSFNGALSNATAAATITVAALNPNVAADNYYALPGSIIHVTGSGFAKGEKINVAAGSFNSTATADNSGATGSIAVTLPFGSPLLSQDIGLTGVSSHAAAHTTITLASFMPSVTPSTYFTAPGSQLTFTGQGFAAGEDVSYTLNNQAAGNIVADAAGTFSTGPLTTPFHSGTNAHYIFAGSLSNSKVAVDIALSQFFAGIQLNNYYSQGGAPETITGSGFAPLESVSIDFGGNTLGPVKADSTGAFIFASNVPFAAPGNKIIRATGQSSGAFANITFTEAPVFVSIQLGSYAGKPGTAINFIGSGYLPNEPINIATDRTGSAIVQTFNADASGNFNNSSYVIPANFTEGNLKLTIAGTHSFNPQDIIYFVVHP